MALLLMSIFILGQTITESLKEGTIHYANGNFFVYGFSGNTFVLKKYNTKLELKGEYSKGVRLDSKESGVQFGWEGKNIVIFIPYAVLLTEGLFIRVTENLKEISAVEMNTRDGKAERKRVGLYNLQLQDYYNDSMGFYTEKGVFQYGTYHSGYPYWTRFEKEWETSLKMGKTDESYSFPMYLIPEGNTIIFYSNEKVGKGYQQFLSGINVKAKTVDWRTPLNTAPNSIWSPSKGIMLSSGKTIIAGVYSEEDLKQKKVTLSSGETYGLAHMTGNFLMKLDGNGQILATKTFPFSQSRDGLPGKYEKDKPLSRVHTITATNRGSYIALIEEYCYAGVQSTKDQLKEGFGGPQFTFVTLGFSQVEFNENLEILKVISTKPRDFEEGLKYCPGIAPGMSTGMDCYQVRVYGGNIPANWPATYGPTVKTWTSDVGESVIAYKDYFGTDKFNLVIFQFTDGVAQKFELSTDEDFHNINKNLYHVYITGSGNCVLFKSGKEEISLTKKSF